VLLIEEPMEIARVLVEYVPDPMATLSTPSANVVCPIATLSEPMTPAEFPTTTPPPRPAVDAPSPMTTLVVSLLFPRGTSSPPIYRFSPMPTPPATVTVPVFVEELETVPAKWFSAVVLAT
jgi:hypothetical protein